MIHLAYYFLFSLPRPALGYAIVYGSKIDNSLRELLLLKFFKRTFRFCFFSLFEFKNSPVIEKIKGQGNIEEPGLFLISVE